MAANIFFKDLGNRIAKYRKEQNITQEELAIKLGIKQSAMALYESGKRRLPLSLLFPITEALYIDIEDLLGIAKKKDKRGPKSSLQKEFERIQGLPVNKQKKLIEIIDTFIKGLQQRTS
jgi:transcriptional regulator with XRE-family HTH domain